MTKLTAVYGTRVDVGLDASQETAGGGADQSFTKMCDINNIMTQYQKTGMFPHVNTIPAQYVDNTVVPSLEEAFNIVNKAQEAFFSLPPDVRKLMDNDPSKLENFIADEKNHKFLMEHGVMVEKPQKIETQGKKPEDPTQSPAANPANTTT